MTGAEGGGLVSSSQCGIMASRRPTQSSSKGERPCRRNWSRSAASLNPGRWRRPPARPSGSSPSFLRELFLGNFRLDLIHPYPLPAEERPEFAAFYDALKAFLRDEVDPVEIDAHRRVSASRSIDGLRKLGAFGMKIPKEYGGLGFTQRRVPAGSWSCSAAIDGNIAALLSAHQSIGVPQPLKLFGTRRAEEEVPAALRARARSRPSR